MEERMEDKRPSAKKTVGMIDDIKGRNSCETLKKKAQGRVAARV